MTDKDQKLTVVVFRRREFDPFEARVLQSHRLGPNLSPKTGTAYLAKSAAERRLRADGWVGLIVYEEGLPDSVKSLPPRDEEPARPRRGLQSSKPSDHTEFVPVVPFPQKSNPVPHISGVASHLPIPARSDCEPQP